MALVSAAMGGGDQGAKRVAGAKSNGENGCEEEQGGCKIHGASRTLQADDISAANIKRDASILFLAIATRLLFFCPQTRHGPARPGHPRLSQRISGRGCGTQRRALIFAPSACSK